MVEIKENYRRLPDPDKVDLIYTYNKKTPLFVRKADYTLEENDLEEAIQILTKGLKNYPNYAAPYLLLGKAYALKGDYTLAIENIKKGSELIPSEKTFDYYLNEIENIKNRISLGFSSYTYSEIHNIQEETEREGEYEIKSFPKDMEIEELVKEIAPETGIQKEGEKIEPEKSFGKNIIVSETLAKIYTSQGEYKEAIEIYNLLKEKHPEKVDYYSQKIEEINDKLD